MTRQALSPRLAIRIFVNMLSSHPEHAEACVRDRCVGGGGEAEPESAAGLRGIDDAVIPEPGGRVVRTALRVELFAGRRSEEHTSELQSLIRISYAVLCLKKKNKN